MIRAPQSGFVVEKKIVAGASVEAKMTLLEIADLSSVWVEAEVYEKDIAFLQPGQKVEATVEAYPNRTFTGELASIYPQVEATTRTNRIRVRLENPDNELRPGMYAAVTIDTPLETIEPYKTLAAKTVRTVLVDSPRPQPSAGARRGAWRSPAATGVPRRAGTGRGRYGREEDRLCPAQGRGCSRASKSNWDRGRMISTPCSKVFPPATGWRRRAGSSSMPKRGSIRPRLRPTSAPAAARSPRSQYRPLESRGPCRDHVPWSAAMTG